jgi:alpha-tubulin suppressor-like RCC1 family protein
MIRSPALSAVGQRFPDIGLFQEARSTCLFRKGSTMPFPRILTVVILLFTMLAAPARAATAMVWTALFTGTGGSTCAIRSDGTLWCWGGNESGQLGDGTTKSRNAPVQVGDDRNWASVSPGGSHTCAIRTDGSLWCWGGNYVGQLGLGTDAPGTRRPARVGTETTWASVTTAFASSCAIRTDGSLWCWGRGTKPLPDGTNEDSRSPVRVGDQTWATVDLGGGHTCGIRTDGTLWCWGFAFHGELGLGTDIDTRPHPVQVGTSASWVSLDTAYEHTCAIDTEHQLWCWGDNRAGKLGDGTGATRNVPVRVGAGTSWASVATGLEHTCAVTTDGRTRCWGGNDNGELGDNTTISSSNPVAVNTDLIMSIVGAGLRYSCALTTTGNLWCWGDNHFGILGDGTSVSSPSVASAVRVGTDTGWADATVGDLHSCGRRTDGTLWCWGGNTHGQVGDGRMVPRSTPAPIPGGATWQSVTADHETTCGIRTGGTLWCWGETFTDSLAIRPVQIGGRGGWANVALGESRACAVHTDGTIWCWGSGVYGQSSEDPPLVRVRTDVATTWAQAAVGRQHLCARDVPGRVWCWGEGFLGPNGDGAATTPGVLAGLTGVVALQAPPMGTCALDEEHRLWCWSDIFNPESAKPQLVAGDQTWAKVSVVNAGNCGIRLDASLWCWGSNFDGQLGDGTTTDHSTPVRSGTASWLAVGTGKRHTCGIRTDHSLWCWGRSSSGQLGRPMVARRVVPVP